MKICVIGGGSIGKRHLSNLKCNFTEIELYCLKRSPSPSFEKEYSCKVIHTKRDILKNNIETLIVCTPTSMHLEWIKLASENRLNIFIEKPLVSDQNQLQTIKSIRFDHSVSFIGYMMRYHGQIQKIKNLISSDLIGKVYCAELAFGSYLPDWPYVDYKNSYVSLKSLGGGVVRTISHEIDLIYYLFGDPEEIISVNKNFGYLGIECEEIHKSIVVFKNKLVGLSLDLLTNKYRREISIYGDKGCLKWDWNTNNIIHMNYIANTEQSIKPVKNSSVNDLYIDELNDFMNKINLKVFQHDMDFEYAKKNMNLILRFANEL